jgi:hypothetical protein
MIASVQNLNLPMKPGLESDHRDDRLRRDSEAHTSPASPGWRLSHRHGGQRLPVSHGHESTPGPGPGRRGPGGGGNHTEPRRSAPGLRRSQGPGACLPGQAHTEQILCAAYENLYGWRTFNALGSMPVIPGHRSLGHRAGPGATVVKSEFVYKQSMGSTSSAVSTSVSFGGKYLFGLSFSLLMIVSASLYLSKEAPCIRSEDVQAHTNSLSSLEAKPSAHLRIPVDQGFPIVGEESIMSAKAHGTCASAVQTDLRWNCDRKVADNICCFNRHYAGELSSLNIFFLGIDNLLCRRIFWLLA